MGPGNLFAQSPSSWDGASHRVSPVRCPSWVGCVGRVISFSTPIVITKTSQNNRKRGREIERKAFFHARWAADERRGVPFLINLTVLDKSVSLLWCCMCAPFPKEMETSLPLYWGRTQEEEPCPHWPCLAGLGLHPRGLHTQLKLSLRRTSQRVSSCSPQHSGARILLGAVFSPGDTVTKCHKLGGFKRQSLLLS